jgi:hypothetical protein
MKTKIWYSIQNGGDGSAFPEFFESEELCKIDQEYMDEGWGDPCLGCLTIEHNGPINIIDEKIYNVDEIIEDTKDMLTWAHSSSIRRLTEKLEALNKLKEKQIEKKGE